ncbi:MAG: sulfite exporter TauE/SafE family protein [Gammaproteobacteria bacterium]|nr:sulfite exporter TauE/SafE family protein [Gammaproteobacteria bacterium]
MEAAFVLTGFVVGAVIGLSGMGGGALMTPALLFAGVPPTVAVGTDLLFAPLTKFCALVQHQRSGTVRWPLVRLLALGSLPGAALALLVVSRLVADGADLQRLIVGTLSVSLVATALMLLLGRTRHAAGRHSLIPPSWQAPLTVAAGAVVGVLVALSSVGAGALGVAVLFLLYPALPAARIVGSDIAHALPLALFAGLWHLGLGHVDFALLGSLLLGSLPGTYLGSRAALAMPEPVMRPLLGGVLLAIGVGMAVHV